MTQATTNSQSSQEARRATAHRLSETEQSPPSVDALLIEAEIEAERVTGFVRVALAVSLAASIFASTGLASIAEMSTLRRPLIGGAFAIGAFFAVGLLSLAVVAARRYAAWMAFVFTTADAAIITVAVWATLNAAHVTGNWLAAAPAIWAVPLVLTLGALRYRPAVQFWITTLLLLGLGSVALNLGFEPFPTGAESAPGLEVLHLFSLPAYLMRAVILLLTALTTALVMVRARGLLRRAVAEATQRANLARFLPAEVAPLVERLTIAEWRRGRRQTITVLFVDIRDSTALAEDMDPTSLSVLISAFRRRIMRAAQKHGGVIDKFIGDGALVVFGIPDPRPDDAQRGLACAREILSLVARWNSKRQLDPPVRVGVGVHSGEAYCGIVGDDARLEFTVLGDMVNVAARIEQATKQFGVPMLASEATLRAAGELQSWTEISREAPRGRRRAIGIYAAPK